jgi:hypothetical protein
MISPFVSSLGIGSTMGKSSIGNSTEERRHDDWPSNIHCQKAKSKGNLYYFMGMLDGSIFEVIPNRAATPLAPKPLAAIS